ncbi:response regulator transcription factor [Thiohalophilus thiocyanatoxydans]|uniref:DNA-binding response OmpR family regulator n=1 Tax=Thiohalophilus thiocyanatoxydans TaxID=381308 RepID=A0A4R8IGZ8_9GAMM|nr:response regulator transcription factor [Thiohalophilus thiocyanatoxydans]TDX99343.1 DNA-binding response OmpR family regulator [Thiohalophilus thiocyanatoxydans]
MRLLLVEDETELAESLKAKLIDAGYVVDLAHDGIEGEYLGGEFDYDVAILDLGLPERAGLEVLKNWRETGITTPVLILTARDSWQDKVTGLQAGGDDYLAKPFHSEELLARVQALIRRRYQPAGARLQGGEWVLDEETRTVSNGEQSFQLTGTEYRLLRYFMLNPGKVLSKTRLTEHVYEMDADRDSNVIEVYVRRLRERLGKEIIRTQRGQGYIFEP